MLVRAPDSRDTDLQKLAGRWRIWPADTRSSWVLAGAAAILGPALICGPWLPFCDLVAFVGMNNFPPPASTGPLQFSVFQFTYIVHYALSRFLHDLGVPPSYQVLGIYLLQAGSFFWVIQTLLKRFVAHPWICSVAIATGALAYWDGMFVWGGPLAYSLSAVMVALATAVSLQEIEEPVPGGGLCVALLLVVAMMCHPFAFVFCVFLAALRWWFLPARRWQTSGLLVFLGIFAFVIRADSAERIATPQLSALFQLSWSQLGHRLHGLFTIDARSVQDLFGSVPAALRCYYYLLALVHLAGFLAAPVVAVLARGRPALRMLAVLITGVAAMYFLSMENALVTQWPQRILTFYSPFTFVGGVVFPWFLVQRFRPSFAANLTGARWRWGIPAVILAALCWVQWPILRQGAEIGANHDRLRAFFAQSQVRNAFIVVQEVERVQPYFLRAVPFLLFSDPEMVRRNNLFFTEWHLQPRHPTRVIEHWFDLGRARVNASFSSANGQVEVSLTGQPPGIAPVPSGNDPTTRVVPARLAALQRALGDQLLSMGAARDAVPHYEAALQFGASRAELASPLAVALVRTNRPADAIRHLRLVVEAQPDHAEAHCDLGILLVQGGESGGGILHLQKAVELRPTVAQWRYELGMALLSTNRRAEAAGEFRQALHADSELRAASEELERLSR